MIASATFTFSTCSAARRFRQIAMLMEIQVSYEAKGSTYTVRCEQLRWDELNTLDKIKRIIGAKKDGDVWG